MSDRHFLHCPTRESLWGINLSTKNPPSSWAADQSFFRRPIFSFFFRFFPPRWPLSFRSFFFSFLPTRTRAPMLGIRTTAQMFGRGYTIPSTKQIVRRAEVRLAFESTSPPKVPTQSQFRSRGCMLLAPGSWALELWGRRAQPLSGPAPAEACPRGGPVGIVVSLSLTSLAVFGRYLMQMVCNHTNNLFAFSSYSILPPPNVIYLYHSSSVRCAPQNRISALVNSTCRCSWRQCSAGKIKSPRRKT